MWNRNRRTGTCPVAGPLHVSSPPCQRSAVLIPDCAVPIPYPVWSNRNQTKLCVCMCACMFVKCVCVCVCVDVNLNHGDHVVVHAGCEDRERLTPHILQSILHLHVEAPQLQLTLGQIRVGGVSLEIDPRVALPLKVSQTSNLLLTETVCSVPQPHRQLLVCVCVCVCVSYISVYLHAKPVCVRTYIHMGGCVRETCACACVCVCASCVNHIKPMLEPPVSAADKETMPQGLPFSSCSSSTCASASPAQSW